ncbi:leucine-rich_repeat domain-containing protein [Hexamita inflata]|uniref:Leucine-rich repeat domain-containing protein n=1 Tax=Hexamita inflata TaxID=28002 RepID=A0AA86RIF8_9EUKA|nr:leucine-rich repeat domain-containing protein [Hexamita inflata]
MTEYVTEQNQNALNEEYEAKMTLKYAGKIKDSNLEIGNPYGGDSEVTNLRFLEKFDIQTLKLHISNEMSVKLRSSLLKELSIFNEREYDQKEKQKQRLNMQVDDLELENLEVLKLENNKLEDYQLYNLAKFKKLHSLDVSKNQVDLTHIHMVLGLTILSMRYCSLKNIDLISSLVNLQELNLSGNTSIDLSPLYKIDSLTILSLNKCRLKNIDQIVQLTNLEVLNISDNNQLQTIDSIRLLVNLKELDISQNKQIDITPLKNLVGLIKLNLSFCALTQLSALKPLTNLQDLDLSYNPNIIITELQYLKKLTHLNLEYCNLVSICVLRPLVNLQELNISKNNIVYLDAHLNEMKKLQTFRVESNLISDFKSLKRLQIIKHPNYNNFDENCQKFLNKFNQTEPSKEEVRQAKQIIRIELQNLKLKEIPHKSLQTAFNNCKQEINATMNNARQSQIQFTAKIIHLFQYLNKSEFE